MVSIRYLKKETSKQNHNNFFKTSNAKREKAAILLEGAKAIIMCFLSQ